MAFNSLQIRDQTNHFHQQIQIRFLLRGHVDKNGLAAPLFRHQAAISQLFFTRSGKRVRLVNFVYRDNDRNFGGVSMIDRFERLRHHAIVSGHD